MGFLPRSGVRPEQWEHFWLKRGPGADTRERSLRNFPKPLLKQKKRRHGSITPCLSSIWTTNSIEPLTTPGTTYVP